MARTRILVVLAVLVCGTAVHDAAAATCTWKIVPVDALFSNPDNWTGCGATPRAPATGDSLAFPYHAGPQRNVTNDLPADTRFVVMHFEGGYGVFGARILVGSAIEVLGASTVVSLYTPLQLTGTPPSHKTLSVAAGTTLELHGILSQASGLSDTGITKTGAGVLRLFAANTHRDTTAVEGWVYGYTTSSFGQSGTLTVEPAATASIEFCGTAASQALLLHGTDGTGDPRLTVSCANIVPSVTWPGAVTLTGVSHLSSYIDVPAVQQLSLNGPLDGGGVAGFTKVGAGSLIIAGSGAVTTGLTRVRKGGLQLTRPGVTAVPAGLVVGDGTGLAADASVVVSTSNQVAGNVTLDHGTLDLSAGSDTIGTLTLSAARVTTTGVNQLTVSGTITVVASASTSSIIEGRLDLGAGQVFDVPFNNGNPDLDVPAIVSGGSLTKSGTGRLRLSGANTYTGVTTVNDGVIDVANPSALGSPAAGTVVKDGATIGLEADVALEPLTAEHGQLGAFTLACRKAASTLTWGGPVTTTGFFRPYSNLTTCAMRFTGTISGPGGFIVQSSPQAFVELGGAGTSTYAGRTDIYHTVRLLAANRIPDASPVRLYGTLQLNGFSESLTPDVVNFGATATAKIELGAGTLTLLPPASSTTFYGAISGTGGVVVDVGPRTFSMASVAVGTYTGPTTVKSGALAVSGSLVGPTTVQAAGTLAGMGTVGAVTTTGGTVQPTTVLHTGTLTLNAGAKANFVVNGAGPGVGHTQLAVTGGVTLGGATLQLVAGTAPAGTFTIIDNDGADAVTGTFAGIAEGGTVTLGARTYAVSYTGGDGNDVVLSTPGYSVSGTVIKAGAPAPGVTVTLSGGCSGSALTGGNGTYVIANLSPAATCTVTPSSAGKTFQPASTTLAIDGNETADFVIEVPTFTMRGRVIDLGAAPQAGVTVTLSGAALATTQTDATGHFAFSGFDQTGPYTITAQNGVNSFLPQTQSVPILLADTTLPPFVAQVGTRRTYLAEGATSAFFDTRIALLNTQSGPTQASLTFQVTGPTCPGGCVRTHDVVVGGETRVTIDPKTIAGLEADFAHAEFSTTVESASRLIVDRTLAWDVASGYGAHAETSVASPAEAWYLAEGATHSGFNLFYLLQNPNAVPATVRVRYLRPSGVPLEKQYTLPPTSRNNIWVNEEDFAGQGKALASTDVSAVIESLNGQPIIVERALYLDLPGQMFGAGHESAGVTATATQWFLAEGATGPMFDLFILIANPGPKDAQVDATYLLPNGTTITKTYYVIANSRFNIWVDGEDAQLANTAVSTTITSTNNVPVIVERALWWPGSYGSWFEAHNSPGATATGMWWAMAEGEVGGPRNADTYILVANTSAFTGSVSVTLMFEDGTSAEHTYDIAAKSRFNVDVRSEFPGAVGRRFGALIKSQGNTPAQIVVERAMYWNAAGQTWAAGTNALATRLQ